VEGVEVVEIDYNAKTATIACEGDVDMAALAAALEKSGYGCEVASN